MNAIVEWVADHPGWAIVICAVALAFYLSTLDGSGVDDGRPCTAYAICE